jgi:lysosomal alpha-mannosidase
VVTRYSTGLATAGTWWTDSNGRELRKRERFFRPHWNLTVTEPISGEYYPVNFAIATADARTGTTLSVVTDRTQGGSSLVDGSVELMVHRRLQHDDDRGVGQPLNETGVDGLGLTIRGLHRLQLSTAATARRDVRFAMADATFRPLTTFAPVTGPAIAWGLSFTSEYSGLTAPLPPNLQVLTAHAQDANTLLLRLAHNFEVGEDATYSANATVSLSNLFAPFTITSVVETDLSGATPLAELPRYTLRGDDGSVSEHPVLPEPMGVDAEGGITVTLTPMQIRTFFATIAPAATSAGAATAQ